MGNLIFLLMIIGMVVGVYFVIKAMNQTTRQISEALDNLRNCPFCKKMARKDASVCPHCTRDIPVAQVESQQ